VSGFAGIPAIPGAHIRAVAARRVRWPAFLADAS
jgi:hypothetical protein